MKLTFFPLLLRVVEVGLFIWSSGDHLIAATRRFGCDGVVIEYFRNSGQGLSYGFVFQLDRMAS